MNLDINAAWELIAEWVWLLIPFLLLQAILLITALISILRKKNVTGSEKLPWILLAIFVNVFGPIIYFIFGSNFLDKKAAEREDDR